MAERVVEMGFIEKRPGEQGYRARYNDPLGRKHSRTFAREADAQRFLLEMEADKARGAWIDPRGADMPLAAWAEEFLLLARRLSPTTVQTYRRDLDRYVLPGGTARRGAGFCSGVERLEAVLVIAVPGGEGPGKRPRPGHLDGSRAKSVAPLHLAEMPAGERHRIVNHDDHGCGPLVCARQGARRVRRSAADRTAVVVLEPLEVSGGTGS